MFGDKARYLANLARWWPGPGGAAPHDRPSVLLANMAAYEGWQRLYRDVWRARRLAAHRRRPNHPPPPVRQVQLDGERRGGACTEEGWCQAHGVCRTALLAVEEVSLPPDPGLPVSPKRQHGHITASADADYHADYHLLSSFLGRKLLTCTSSIQHVY